MFTEDPPRGRPPRSHQGPAGHLRTAIAELSEGKGQILRHSERPWASVTFEGERHSMELRFLGIEAVQAGEILIAALADHEFSIPGHLVADATVTAVDHIIAPEPCLTVACEVLLLKDA